MIRLICRQLRNNWKGLVPLLIVWAIAAYLIFPYRNLLFSRLANFFAQTPEIGEEDTKTAYDDFIVPARELLGEAGFWCKQMPEFLGGCSDAQLAASSVRLDLMIHSCRHLPIRFHLKESPDWLETLKAWEAAGAEDLPVTNPDHYWNENQGKVREALKLALHALQYAYEIPKGVTGSDPLLVPELIAKYGEALCRSDIGILAWGDYAEFLEVREYKKIEPDAAGYYLFTQEKNLMVLERLRGNKNYLRALKEYSAGAPPDSGVTGCSTGPFNLVCAAPAEAIKTLNKLVYLSDRNDLPFLYLKLGKLIQFSNLPSHPPDSALHYYLSAFSYPTTRLEAGFDLVRFHLNRRELSRGYAYLLELKKILREKRFEHPTYRNLARHILIDLGRFEAADCFSEQTRLTIMARAACDRLEL